jgi:hypothetical protein
MNGVNILKAVKSCQGQTLQVIRPSVSQVLPKSLVKHLLVLMLAPGKLFRLSVIYASKAIPNGAPHSQIFDQAGSACQGLTLGIAVSDDEKSLTTLIPDRQQVW